MVSEETDRQRLGLAMAMHQYSLPVYTHKTLPAERTLPSQPYNYNYNSRLDVETVADVVKRGRLRWFVHLGRSARMNGCLPVEIWIWLELNGR